MEEEVLIERVKEKDETAFEILVEQYKPIVEKFAFQFGVSPEYVPDIVQETFIKIFRKSHLYNRGKLTTWVYRITMNVSKDHFRKQKRDQKVVSKAKMAERNAQKYRYFFEKEEHVILHECLQHLELKYRTPLILFYFHDKSYEEIASILRVKTSSVKTRIHRAKNLLKKSMEKHGVQEVYNHG